MYWLLADLYDLMDWLDSIGNHADADVIEETICVLESRDYRP